MAIKQGYACDACSRTFDSMSELRTHYKKEHPESMEKITLPI